MVFSSPTFIFLFLPLVFIVNLCCRKSIKRSNALLLLASLLFYAWGEPVYVLLMLLTTFVNYLAALLMVRFPAKKKLFVTLSVVWSLGILIFFKYTDFLIESVNGLLGLSVKTVGIALPIGISFFTFQAMSYVLDVYRGDAACEKSFFRVMLYISLFPQLIAGPIVKYHDVAKELACRSVTPEKTADGLRRFCFGLGKKVLLSNALAVTADAVYALSPDALSAPAAWLGAAAYLFQIYFDFSGYSDMAIGLGRAFGFTFRENFNYPYVSSSMQDFWRRWHISLSSFFRDYVYIPLGGNRRHQMLNLFAVWALTGLWHGSSWNFVLWGLYYFAFLVVEKFLLKRRLERIPVISNILTMLVVMVGWAIFYFEDIGQCLQALGIMFGLGSNPLWESTLTTPLVNNLPMLCLAALCCLPIGKPVSAFVNRLRDSSPALWFACTGLYQTGMLFLCVASLVSSSYNPFLYFRF